MTFSGGEIYISRNLFMKRAAKVQAVLASLFAAAFFFFAAVQSAWAFDPFEVRDIRVEGVQRVEPGTVFSYLPVRVGQQMTNAKSSEAIRALYATGFFKDVRLEVADGVLIVYVSERPAIAQLDVSGSKEFAEEALKKSLSDLGLAEAKIFDRSLLERAEQELKRQYLSRGKYAVTITSTVTPMARNRVALNLKVDEGESARIVAIRFVGNEKYSEAKLLDVLRLSTPTWMTWYTRNDQYSREKLAGDLESVRSFYLDRGYLEFGIQSTQVSITPDKQDVHVSIVVKEGDQYTVSKVAFAGRTLGREAEFTAMMQLKPGDVFSGEKLSETRRLIAERLGELGYAFADVNALPKLDREKRQVEFNVLIDPGRRVYVRRINIVGNAVTQDTVVRRELRQFENAWYDADKIRLSRSRLSRLGFFTDVRINTVAVPGIPDQVDLEVRVVENPTSNISLGIGTSSTEKVIISASLDQPNFAGTGKSLSVNINTSKVSRTISLAYTDPYFTPDGVSRKFSAYSRLFNASELDLGKYKWRSNGIGLNFGIPYTEHDRFNLGLALENNTIDIANVTNAPGADLDPDTPPKRYEDFVFGPRDAAGNPLPGAPGVGRSSTALLAKFGWRRDSRDSAFAPTVGKLQSASLEVTLPVGELRYYKTNYRYQIYYPISKDYTFAFNTDLGYARAFGGRRFPPFKVFYAGGIGSVRGYAPSSLGSSRDEVTDTPLGGLTKIVGNIEFILPVAGTGNDRRFRWFVFLDGGNVFPEGKIDTKEFRFGAGLGLNWASPIGPMKFSLGYPLNAEDGDKSQRIQFQVGTAF